MITCKELRERARNSLENNIFGGTWLFALLACFVVSGITSVLAGSTVLAILVPIFYGCFQFGLVSFFLNTVRRTADKNDLKPLISGFTDNITRNIASGLLVSLFVFLWSLLLVIPGIVMAYAYSMTFYIMKDNPNLTALEAMKKSKEMMNGYKMQAFLLDLSFIGWWIVGILTCGIGTLWVAPYAQAAKTELYEYIRANRQGQFTIEA